MTGAEIKAAAEGYIGEPISIQDAKDAINEALRILADVAELYADATLTATQDNQWVSLPADCTSVVALRDPAGRLVQDAFRQGTFLRLPKAGTYTLRYKRLPSPLTDLAQEPDVPRVFHQAIVDYVIGWWKLKEDEENPDGKDKMRAFLERAREAVFALRRQRWPRAIRVERDGQHAAGRVSSLGVW